MIEEQRLEELIQQGATIYKISKETFIAGVSDLLKIDKVPSGLYSQEISDRIGQEPDYDLLFETEEDARWELEMTETRTETLKMPKWEDAQDEKFSFTYLIDVKGLFLYINIYNFTKKLEIYCSHGVHTHDYKFGKTFDLRDKEQYKMACKLCLRLFKGEEV